MQLIPPSDETKLQISFAYIVSERLAFLTPTLIPTLTLTLTLTLAIPNPSLPD